MAVFIINAAKVVGFLAVTLSAIVSMYSAVNAVAVASGFNVFLSGVFTIFTGVLFGPLFCYIAGHGLVRYLDQPLPEAIIIVAPVLLAWCFAAGRIVVNAVR